MTGQGVRGDARCGTNRSFPAGGLVRRRVYVLIALQVMVPLVLLGLRWNDPGLNQLPFGWQMHTDCWGAEEPCR
jgi:hypothetical protein